METKKILVTGSLGYIGSVLTPYLNKNNYECIGYDTGFFKDCILYPPEEKKTIFKDARQITEDDLKDIDVLIHLAGISNDPFGKLKAGEVYDPTLDYSLHLAEICKKLGAKFVFASSCSIYGKASDEILTEDSPVNPQTPYSLNKLQIEEGLKQMTDRDFSPIMLRFATVFGSSPRMRFDLFINMFAGMTLTMDKIVLNSDGKAWRPNVYIEDVLKAIKYAVEYDPPASEPIILNVGDNAGNFRVIDIAYMFTEVVPGTEIAFLSKENCKPSSKEYELIKDKKIEDGADSRTYKVTFEKIKKTFKGFHCDWPIKRGIKNLIKMLDTIKLTEKKFKNVDFYRLQKFEYLLNNNYLSKDLYWIDQK
jgi:nucleoside-diphosphate-sugar epimerase